MRPYPVATAGTPTPIVFDPATRRFTYRFTADPAVKAPTELFIPRFQYPGGYRVRVQNARYAIQADPARLFITDATGPVTVDVTPR